MFTHLSCHVFITIRTRYIFFMNLGRTRECLKSRKYRRSLNKVKIIPAEHSKIKITITCPLKKIKAAFPVVKRLYLTDTVTMQLQSRIYILGAVKNSWSCKLCNHHHHNVKFCKPLRNAKEISLQKGLTPAGCSKEQSKKSQPKFSQPFWFQKFQVSELRSLTSHTPLISFKHRTTITELFFSLET